MTRSRLIGILFQALVLGSMLFFSIGKLVALESGALVFRYQAF